MTTYVTKTPETTAAPHEDAEAPPKTTASYVARAVDFAVFNRAVRKAIYIPQTRGRRGHWRVCIPAQSPLFHVDGVFKVNRGPLLPPYETGVALLKPQAGGRPSIDFARGAALTAIHHIYATRVPVVFKEGLRKPPLSRAESTKTAPGSPQSETDVDDTQAQHKPTEDENTGSGSISCPDPDPEFRRLAGAVQDPATPVVVNYATEAPIKTAGPPLDASTGASPADGKDPYPLPVDYPIQDLTRRHDLAGGLLAAVARVQVQLTKEARTSAKFRRDIRLGTAEAICQLGRDSPPTSDLTTKATPSDLT